MTYYLQISAVVIPLEETEVDKVTAKKIFDLLKNDDWVILGQEGKGPIAQWTVMTRKENGDPVCISYMNCKGFGLINV